MDGMTNDQQSAAVNAVPRRRLSCEQAEVAMAAVREHCGHGDPSAAIAFAEISNRLMAAMVPSDFTAQPRVVAFVFTGLYSLRDWVFNTGYRPSMATAQSIFGDFSAGLRLRLLQCNGSDSYSRPDNVNALALWDFYHHEFLPVVAALRFTGDAKTDLGFLSKI
jgi:hypothetical protein